jgi:transcriptional regulator with XRE-family HTH domain
VLPAGQRLRGLREELGLTIRDVESASVRIAARHGNEDFAISPSRLSDIETKGILPNIYRLYSLSVIYRRDLRELLAWFDIDLNETAADLTLSQPAKSHISDVLDSMMAVNVPVRLDPGFDLCRTVNLGRMIERWGLVPLGYLSQFSNSKYTYGYIGTEDFTMYPVLLPGSFIQVDEAANKVAEGNWRSEYERPIYFVELRDGHTACWCSLKGDYVVLQPHPLSPVPVRMLKQSQEVEILGQVVGIVMRLDGWRHPPSGETPPTGLRAVLQPAQKLRGCAEAGGFGVSECDRGAARDGGGDSSRLQGGREQPGAGGAFYL